MTIPGTHRGTNVHDTRAAAGRVRALADPPGLLQVLRTHWVGLVVAAALVGVLAAWLSSRQPPVFESVAEVRLSDTVSAFDDSVLGARDMERRVSDEVERFGSGAVLERTARAMEGRWTSADVRRALVVRGDASTSYLTVTAQAPSRALAGVLVSRAVEAYETVVIDQGRQDAEATVARIEAYGGDLSQRADALRTELDARRAEVEADMPVLEPTDHTRELERRLALDATYQDLAQRLSSTADAVEGMQARALEARLGAALGGSGVEDFDVVRAPLSPVSPAPVRDGLLAAVLALALGLAVLWTRAGRESAHLSADRVASAFDVPLLARLTRGSSGDPVATTDTRTAAEYARILAAIEYELVARPSVATALVSTEVDGGATATVLNVGVLAMRQGRTVLLVDADLRNRTLTRAVGLEGRPGWSDLGTLPTDDCIHLAYVDGVGVAVVPAGTQHELRRHPTGGVLRNAMASFAEVELVLVDTPPLITAVEASLAAQASDQVLLVVPPACRADTTEAVAVRLSRAGTPVLGVVESPDPVGRHWADRLRRRRADTRASTPVRPHVPPSTQERPHQPGRVPRGPAAPTEADRLRRSDAPSQGGPAQTGFDHPWSASS